MHYVYLHVNEAGVFYVGCGNKKRPWVYSNRSALWKRAASGGYSVLILSEYKSKDGAWEHEKELIAYFKPSCNQATGGPSCTGITRTMETRDKMSSSQRGEKNHRHKLTKEQVLAIREDPRPQRTIAVDYRISISWVSNIKSRKVWSYL